MSLSRITTNIIRRSMSSSSPTAASAVLVGSGCPKRSMGWYHAVQMLDFERNVCPSASLKYAVEPWYMSRAGKSGPGAGDFEQWKQSLRETVPFFERVRDVPPPASGERRLGILSARTADNPALFQACIDIGCHAIYLEKPGAPTVAELENMAQAAEKASVPVLMGFNKNVSSYSTKTIESAAQRPGSQVTFVHNNNYTHSQLPECFERNAEGMLKNMAIHELALLVTFYGVTVDTISQVTADKDFSRCQTLMGPQSNRPFTDFDKLKFTITTKSGVQVSVAADRCGGDDSVGIVQDANGNELARYTMPDDTATANIPILAERYPNAMPYFYVQDADYATLKERIAKFCLDGTPAQGVATMNVAIETLKVAEYLTPLLQKQLLE